MDSVGWIEQSERVSEPMPVKAGRWSWRAIWLYVAVFVGGVGGLVGLLFAWDSAHQLNSAHSRLGVYSVDDLRIGVRYVACPGETVRYVELTIPRNGEPQRVWILETPDTLALADGLPIPVELENGRTYEVVVDLGQKQAGQDVEADDPPISGQLLVRDKLRSTAQFNEMAAASCDERSQLGFRNANASNPASRCWCRLQWRCAA